MMRGIGVAMGSLFMIATAIGCGADEAAEDGHAGADHQAQPPCTEPQTVELGSPARGGNVAFFTTAGGDIDITVRGLADGAIDFGD
ncbi:MAG: hypothetical protein ABJA81_08765, partial [Nocardioidaceae bacterium]